MRARTDESVVKAAVEALASLKQQFEQWRAARRTGERIPSPLWAAAVSAMGEHGAYRVSSELRLDYASLERRAALAAGSAPDSTPKPRFVELMAPQALSMTAPAPDAPCVVELANARGATMRLQLRGDALAGLPGLCQAFWSA
jgi:hypothetical protein